MSEPKMRYCFNCGDKLGFYEDRHHHPMDDCGKSECARAARDFYAEEREQAHEELDRQLDGYY